MSALKTRKNNFNKSTIKANIYYNSNTHWNNFKCVVTGVIVSEDALIALLIILLFEFKKIFL